MKISYILVFGLVAGIYSQMSFAGSITDTYANGDVLTAAKLDNIKNEVNDNDTRIAALEAAVAALQTTVSSQAAEISTLTAQLSAANSDIGTLQADVATINGNSVLLLDGLLTYTVDSYGYPTALFTGVNVQVINGVSQTTHNGVGNVIVGYNGLTNASAPFVCSSPSYVTQIDCEAAGLVWARNHKTGSHNVVGGSNNSYASHGGLVFGLLNIVNGTNASVSGGYGNVASGRAASISGGYVNIADGDRSSITGGWNHIASGTLSSITGGERNRASGGISAVHGGFNNTASGSHASVLGGNGQTNSTDFGTTPALP